jgi:hypothetical protein
MEKTRELLDKILNPRPAIQVWQAEVVSVEGDTCTVKILASELQVKGVKLKADEGKGLLLKPAVGSLVLVGTIQNELADLYVGQCSEVEKLLLEQGNNTVKIDKDGVTLQNQQCEITLSSSKVTLKQAQTEIALESGKVSIKNTGTDLKTLFGDLITLLNTLIVLTPAGPSSGLGPNSIAALTQLQTKVNLLLK